MAIGELVPILTPALPIFPAPATLPKVAVPVADWPGRVRELAKKLREGKRKRDEVVLAVEKLTATEWDELEKQLIPTLVKDKLKPQGVELRRIIRFMRHKPKAPLQGTKFRFSGGKVAKLEGKTEVKVTNGGKVSAKTGVTVELGGSNRSDEAYSISYEGPDTANARWLQMIWREVIQEFPAKDKQKARNVPVKRRLDNPSGPTLPYFLTTDPGADKQSAKRRWNADSPSGNSPFYEDKSPVVRTGTSLTIFDFPWAMPTDKLAAEQFNAPTPPATVVTRFPAETYLVHGLDVLYKVKVDITWRIGKDLKVPPPTIAVSGARASGLDGPQRACLAIQHPAFDYLPGAPVGAPLPDDEFDLIPDLAAADWARHNNDLERFEDVAHLAQAEMIRDVTGRGATTINKGPPHKPGLNYQSTLGAEGQTGYIDSRGAYHNPDLPADRNGLLPKVAMLMGGSAFTWGNAKQRGKDFTVSTLRHEMMHATHNNLAIGWLLAWRDAFTDQSLYDWLAKEKIVKRISEVDFALATGGLKATSTTAPVLDPTELLAWTEGFVTSTPFLPLTPKLSLLAVKEVWPAAISGLLGAGNFYPNVTVAAVKDAALARIHRFVCNTLTAAQRTALQQWIEGLLDIRKLNPTDADKNAVSLVKASFGNQTQWLKDVLALVTKSCSK